MDRLFDNSGWLVEGDDRSSPWHRAFAAASLPDLKAYEEVLVPRVFVPLASTLLDGLAVKPGDAVLDLACGTGSVTRLAAARTGIDGRVVGCDTSAGMISIAKSKSWTPEGTDIEYIQASAEAVPMADEIFDVVTCQQGLQFFRDREKALREMHRVLRPGGHVGIAVWSQIESSPPFAALEQAIRDVAGADIADAYRMGPWGLPDGEMIRDLVERAGFSDISLAQCIQPVTFEDGPAQVVASLAFAGVTAEIDRLPDGRQRMIRVVTDRTRGITEAGELTSHVTANIVMAKR